MRLLTFTLTCFLIAQTVCVFGQTPPSVTDTINLPFDTIQLPKRGPNFSNYYVSGQKLFGTTYNGAYFTVYESLNLGATWRLKLDSLTDFQVQDSIVLYTKYQFVRSTQSIDRSGAQGVYNTFISYDTGNFFELKTYSDVQHYNTGRGGCGDGFSPIKRLNDSVLIYAVDKHCEIYHPTGLWGTPYSRISTDNGRYWSIDYYEKMPDFVINGTAFRKKDSFLMLTQRTDFVYDDSIKVTPLPYYGNVVGRSFVSGVYSIYYNTTGNYGLVFSISNKGQTWQIDTLPPLWAYGSRVIQVKDTVFLLANYALYRSDNGQLNNFRRIYPQTPNNHTLFSGLSVAASTIYLNGADRVLFRSTNGGATWQKRNDTEGSVGKLKLFGFGEDLWFYDNNFEGIYHFEDSIPVVRLDTFAGNLPDFLSYGTSFRKDSVYLIPNNNGKMMRSLDKGFTWENLQIDQFIPKADSNRIYGIVRNNIYVISDDNAITFSTYFAPDYLRDLVIKKNKIWAIVGDLTENIRVVRSVDNGQTWATVYKSIYLPNRLVAEGENLWIMTQIGRVFKSTDEGTTWTNLSTGLDIYLPELTRKKGYLFATHYFDESYFYLSKNDGITWTRVNNAPNALITDKYIYTSESVLTSGETYRLKIGRFLIDSLVNKIKSDKTYSLLRGQVLKDNNTNCRQDTADTPFKAKLLRFNGLYNTATDQNGRFSIMLPVDTYKIEIANDRYFALGCGSDTILKNIILRPNTTTDTTLFFQKTKTVRDISLTLTPNGRPRPANELDCVLTLKNIGTETVDSLQVQFDFTNMPVRFVSASPNAVLNGQKLTWVKRNFPPDAEEMLHVTVRIDTTAPLSTELRFYAQTDILNQIDAFSRDNRDSARLRIVGSFDPNDKSVLPDGKIPLSASLDTFDYLIRFQNTGTDTAYKVVVVDTLPAPLDPYSVRVKAASSDYQLVVNKNTLIFTFDRIFLPDSFANERASHGFIRFTVSPKKPLSVGEKLDNRAHIFFDYNAAIMTNTAQNDVFKPSIQTEQTVKLCAGERWQNTIYTRSTVRIDTLQGVLIDTIRTTFLDVKPTFYVQIDTTLRLGDTLFGRSLKDDQKIILARQTIFGCDSTIVYNVHVLKPSETNDFAISKINMSVSPNPTNNWLSIYYNINNAVETEIYLVNSLGQKQRIIKSKSLDTEGGYMIRLDMSHFGIGIYQIILQTSNGVKTVVFSKI